MAWIKYLLLLILIPSGAFAENRLTQGFFNDLNSVYKFSVPLSPENLDLLLTDTQAIGQIPPLEYILRYPEAISEICEFLHERSKFNELNTIVIQVIKFFTTRYVTKHGSSNATLLMFSHLIVYPILYNSPYGEIILKLFVENFANYSIRLGASTSQMNAVLGRFNEAFSCWYSIERDSFDDNGRQVLAARYNDFIESLLSNLNPFAKLQQNLQRQVQTVCAQEQLLQHQLARQAEWIRLEIAKSRLEQQAQVLRENWVPQEAITLASMQPERKRQRRAVQRRSVKRQRRNPFAETSPVPCIDLTQSPTPVCLLSDSETSDASSLPLPVAHLSCSPVLTASIRGENEGHTIREVPGKGRLSTGTAYIENYFTSYFENTSIVWPEASHSLMEGIHILIDTFKESFNDSKQGDNESFISRRSSAKLSIIAELDDFHELACNRPERILSGLFSLLETAENHMIIMSCQAKNSAVKAVYHDRIMQVLKATQLLVANIKGDNTLSFSSRDRAYLERLDVYISQQFSQRPTSRSSEEKEGEEKEKEPDAFDDGRTSPDSHIGS